MREQAGAEGVVTVTIASAVPLPPAPVQVRWYVVVCVGETAAEPEVALFAVKSLLVQEVALVEDHVSVEELPVTMVVGAAVSVAVTPARMVTVAAAVAFPPAPVQVRWYVVVTVGETATFPDTAFPVVKSLLVQEVVLVEDHVSVEESPAAMLSGLAVRVAVGAMLALTSEKSTQPTLMSPHA